MTDLSELDRQIVEAAEAVIDAWRRTGHTTERAAAHNRLEQAVLAKRKAQQDLWPSCTYEKATHPGGRCNRKPTVQRAERNDGGLLLTDFYCEAHRVRTSELGP